MPHFYTKHVVEARQWFDTDEKREEFAAWFAAYGWEFCTRGSQVELGVYTTTYAESGDWIVLTSDDVEEFFVSIKPDVFERNYTAVDL